jgi:hypothetical protein
VIGVIATLKPEKTLPHDQKKLSSDCPRLVVAGASANGRNRRTGAIQQAAGGSRFPTHFDRSIHLIAKGSFGFSADDDRHLFYPAPTAILKFALTTSAVGAAPG